MTEQKRLALGIDLGGTAIKVGVVTHKGEIIGRGERATEVPRGAAGVIANMALAARDAMANAGVTATNLEGAGVGAPGICDVKAGTVVVAVNLSWHNVEAAAMLKEDLGMPVYLDNDANCAALGEQWCGAASGSHHALMITLGTGVGGGLVLDGKIYHGFRGWAGEFGHMPAVEEGGAPCNCGKHGCVETVASATAMANFARQEIEAGRAPYMAAKAAERGGKVDARLVIESARQGDAPAQAVLAKVGEYLGTCVAGLVTALNPELIVIGGGGSHAGDFVLEPMRRVLKAKGMPGVADVCRIVPAELGNDAGIIGAASLVWR